VSEAVIRDLASEDDYQACHALQLETWGNAFREAVPPSLLLVSQKIGGVAAGAFDARGRLLGFVFGLTGIRGGEVTHWSDMLAVRPEAQNAGIGRRLKEFQRRAAASVGARSVVWTFDPLMARNAHMNFNVYGARAVEYVQDMYGTNTGSDLHRGIGTDRLVMEWAVDDAVVVRQREIAAAADETATLRIDIPADVTSILRADPSAAKWWRERTRAQFLEALALGHRILGFRRAAERDRGTYLLAR
jgi:chorismate synthase